MKKITIQLPNSMPYDQLHTLAAEYSVTLDLLVNVAVKHLLDDVELIRNLRLGNVKLE